MHTLLTETGLPTLLAFGLACVVAAWIIHGNRPRHVRTDPGCVAFVSPSTPLGRKLHDRARGRACPVCYPTTAYQVEACLR